MATTYGAIEAAFAGTGLTVRGGFGLGAHEQPRPAECIVLIGNTGSAFWSAFQAGRRDEPDPMDAWTRRAVDPLAAALAARAVYPSDRPYHPFQTWARRAEPVHPSPLGILIHPDYGLWHAYRAALLFDHAVEGLPSRLDSRSPCDSCIGRPCLSACPVGAFDGTHYDVAACAGHLRSGSAPACAELGCRARDACPVAQDKRYPDEQIRFHMDAFVRARI